MQASLRGRELVLGAQREIRLKKIIVCNLVLGILVGSGLVMQLPASPAHANLSNNLAGKWNFDEGSGTTAADSSGHGLNGTITTFSGSPAWISPGRDGSGSALQFNGSGPLATASSTVNLGNNAALDAMPSYILSLWIKFEPGYVGPCGGNGYANLIGRNSSGANWSYMMYIRGDGKVRVHHRQSDGAAKLYDSAAVVPTGQWVHLAQVADGSRLRFYINGVEDANSITPTASNTYNGTALSLPSANTYIGQDHRECAPKATIDEARIYTPFVSPGGVYSGLMAWQKANDGVTTNGSSWHDSSDNGNTATQTTVANQPTFTSNGINFNPAFDFSGSAQYFNYNSHLGINGTADFSSVAVVSHRSFTSSPIVLGSSPGSGQYHMQFGSGGNPWVGTGGGSGGCSVTNSTAVLPINTSGIASAVRGSNVMTVKLNADATTAGSGACTGSYSANRTLGGRPGSSFVNGLIPEYAQYSRALTDAELQRIDSYLAVKYGATLPSVDYVDSGGATIWSRTVNSTHNNNITGIGRDDVSALNQKQSKSQNAGSLVTVGHGNTIATDNISNTNNFTENKDFLLFGDDNGAATWTTTGAPPLRQTLSRTFKVQNTGSVGSVKLQVPDDGSPLPTKLPAELTNVYLLIDTDSDFTAGATSIPMVLIGTNWEANTTLLNSQFFTFATDAPPLPPPDMTAATDSGASDTDNITNDTTPTFTGACVNGQTVILRIDGAAITPTAICASSTYTITPSTPIADGDHTITAGDPESMPLAFTIDTIDPTPGVPDMTAATDSGSSDTDNITNDPTPTFTGGCLDGQTVTLYVDSIPIAPTAVCSSGTYTITPSAAIAEGNHSITASQGVDIAGNTSAQSAPLQITIDTTPPLAPVITGPANGSTISDATPTFSGTGEEGATVVVTDASDTMICQGVVAGGAWSCVPTTPLPEGPATIKANQTDIAGNIGPNSPTSSITIDSSLPAPPIIVTPANGTHTSDTTPDITGTGIPNATLHLVIDSGTPIDITVDGSGNWAYTPTIPLTEGAHMVAATQTNTAGTTSGVSNTNNFTIDTTAPAPPVITGPTDGQELNDETPNIVGIGEPGAEVTVTDDNGNTLCTATVDGGGNWVCVSATLGEGTHTLLATQVDLAGNVSSSSASTTVVIKVNTDNSPAAIEDAAPNSGDGNADGILDSEQGNVTSIVHPVTGAYVTLEVTSGSCIVTRNFGVATEDALVAQEDRTYPLGLFDYTADCYTPGDSASIRIFLDKQYDVTQWEWRKFNANAHTYGSMQSMVTYGTATIGGALVTTVVYQVADGDTLDEDRVANGTFVDPSGPALVQSASSNGITPEQTLPSTGINIVAPITVAILIMGLGIRAVSMQLRK